MPKPGHPSEFKKFLNILILLVFLTLLTSCGSKVSESSLTAGEYFSAFDAPENYFNAAQKVAVEIHYEPGAEPYFGSTSRGISYWQIFEDNMNAIFQFRSFPPQISFPDQLSAMHALPKSGKSDWTLDEILDLALAQRKILSDPVTAAFYVLFLDGYYHDGLSRQTGVIGINITETPIVAIFKPVIRNSGYSQSGRLPQFMEQSTLVHELGHALGFVNNGVPMAVSHQDSEHGAHTSNPDCVMYWLNEGVTDLVGFVSRFRENSNFVMWGPEVLADAQEFSK